MEIPSDRSYHPEHHWAIKEGDVITVGITAYACEKLGDVAFVSLPQVGTEVVVDTPICEVESNKTASDVYAPVSGLVVEINDGLERDPEPVNQDPYGIGWLFKIRESGDSFNQLLGADNYRELIGE